MIFKDFKSKIKALPAFNLNDIRKLDPGFHRQQLSYWQMQGYIQPLAGGYYILTGLEINETVLFMLANKIHSPSYVSLESALAYYKIIPESVLGVTSVTPRKTIQYESGWGIFRYRSIKPPLIGYQVIRNDTNRLFKIANPEKAVLDYLYLNPKIQSIADFEGLRWNRSQLKDLISETIFEKYIKIFDNGALINRVDLFKEYLNA